MISQAQLSDLLLNQSKDRIWMIDPDFHLVYANQAYLSLIKEVTGEEKRLNTLIFVEGFGADYIEKWKTYYERAIKGEYFEIEEFFIHPQTKECEYSHVSVKPVLDEKGNIASVACQSRDITQIVKQRSEARQLMNASLDVFCTMNEEGYFELVSEVAINLWGYTLEEFQGKTIFDFIHPEDIERTSGYLQGITAKSEVIVEPFRFRDGNGRWRWIETVLTSMMDNSGEKRIVANLRDITDKIEQREKLIKAREISGQYEPITIENQLRSAKEKVEKLQDAMSQAGNLAKIGYWDRDFSTNTLTCSDYTYQLFGLTPKDGKLSYNEAKSYFDSPSQEKLAQVTKKLAEEGISYDLELRIINANNEEIFVRKVILPVYNAKKEIVGERGIIQNITDGKYLQKLNNEVARMAKIGSWSYDLIAQKVFWSEQVHQIHETDPKSFVPNLEDAISFYRADFRELVQSSVDHTITTGEGYDFEAVIVTVNKSEVWIRSIGNAEFINGKCVRLYGGFQDINIRKQEEEAKNRFQETLENSLNEIYMFDSKTLKFIYVNKVALLNLGYTQEEIKTLTPLDLKPGYTAASFKQLVGPLLRHEKDKIIFFINHRRKDGSLYPVEVHLQLVAEGNNKRFVAIILDITERKKAEEEDRFKANLLSMIGQAVIATNLDGVVNFWNKAAENIYGWKKEEAVGNNILDLTPNKSSRTQAIQIMELLKKGKSWSGQFDARKKNGTYFPAQVTNSPIYDENNRLTGIIGVSSDISQEVKNKELLSQYTRELERSNTELEQFAFVTSHDLQEPLRMIASFIDLLKIKYGDQLDEKALQYIHFASDGAKRMKQIILDLLDYSRAGRPTNSLEQVDLNEVISEYRQLRSKIISEKSVSLTTAILPAVYSNRVAITQILHSLLDNAIKYVKKGTAPAIKIKATEYKKEWKFSIRDNGIGIDPAFHDQIFIIFQRLHNKGQYDGNGIGLSIAKKHVESLGGKIWVASKPGKSSTFYFTIPKNSYLFIKA